MAPNIFVRWILPHAIGKSPLPGKTEKTGIITHMGLFRFCVLPFGLCNVPGTFERMMDTMLTGMPGTQCMAYLDDVVVFGKTFSECNQRLHDVLRRVKETGLKLKTSKCKLF